MVSVQGPDGAGISEGGKLPVSRNAGARTSTPCARAGSPLLRDRYYQIECYGDAPRQVGHRD